MYKLSAKDNRPKSKLTTPMRRGASDVLKNAVMVVSKSMIFSGGLVRSHLSVRLVSQRNYAS
jgi:hypothetical protein